MGERISKIWFIYRLEYYSALPRSEALNTHYSVNEFWKHYAHLKKPNTEDHVVCVSFLFLKCPTQVNP